MKRHNSRTDPSKYQYDSLNRLTNLTWNLNVSTLAKFSYQLGATGNRTSLNETVGGTNRVYTWQYDNLYRLTNEVESGLEEPYGTLAYQFDSVGNRTNRQSTISQLPTVSYTYNTNDWLTSDQYDLNGNTTNSSGNSYQYDVMNHITNAVVNGNQILMTYDGDGNRVSKAVGGTTTYYLVDDANPSGYSQVLEEWTVTSIATNLSKVYNYGSALISQRGPGISTNYFISDGHGSTRMLTDDGGTVVNVLVYDAYGNLIASNGVLQTAYLYSGQQFDSDLQLYVNRARYLNTGTGRFWTADSMDGNNEDPLSLHKYLYAQDDPVNLIDPSGLYPWGHHLVPQSLYKNASQRVKDIFNLKKNRLDARNYNLHDSKAYKNISRNDYTRAVKEKLEQFIKAKGKTSMEQLSDKELQEFADEIKAIRGGTIGEYNAGVAEEILEVGAEGLEGEEIYELIDIAYGIDGVAMDAGLIDVGL